MENTAEVTRLMTVLNNINGSISQNQIDISKMQEDISNIKKVDYDLKRVYPDLCQLEQIESDIQAQMLELNRYELGIVEDRMLLEDNIKELKAKSSSIVEVLNQVGVSNRRDYDALISDVKQKKDSIPDIEAKITKKDQENIELMEKKNTIEKKLEELSRSKEELVSRADGAKRDLTKQSKINTTSELAAFIEYDTDDDEEVEIQPETNKLEKKKEDEIEDVITRIAKKQNKVLQKFDEIIKESDDDALKEVMQSLKVKFEKEVYKDIHDMVYKVLQKRKEIEELEKEIKETTPTMQEQKLEDINRYLTDSIQEIDNSQQKFEGEIKYNFNDLKTYATNEFNYIKTLKQRIMEQSAEINSKISNIEEKMGQIMLNSEESILEKINKIEKELNKKYQEIENIENNAKQNIISILDGLKQDVLQSDSYERFIQILDDVKARITQQEQDIENKKNVLDKDINELKNKKADLEKKYNQKKEQDNAREEEVLLLDSKRLLKEESQKVIDMVNILTNKQQSFIEKIEHDKLNIKSDIIEKDNVIAKQKNELIDNINERMKSLPEKLKESVEEYNRKYIIEFENLMKSVIVNINEIEKENMDYKAKTTNIVVLSEFDENSQLLDELKDLVNEGVLVNKDIEDAVNVDVNLPKSSIEKEIEQNMMYIKPEDTIDSKIDFAEIYEMQSNITNIDEIKQNVYNLCARLNMEDEIKIEHKQEAVQEKKKQMEQEQKQEVQVEEQVGQDIKIEQQEQEIEQAQEKEVQVEEQVNIDKVVKIDKIVQKELASDNNKRRASILGMDDYSKEEQEILKDIPWEQLIELKNMNKMYKRTLYIDDLKQLRDEKVVNISNLKQEYKQAVAQAKKLYEIKKYVLAYKKGMEELAKGSNSTDKEAQKQYANSMKMASKSLKIMKENGVSSFEDFRYQVLKNSEQVKKILSDTKAENEELVKFTGLIQAIEKPNELSKPEGIRMEM